MRTIMSYFMSILFCWSVSGSVLAADDLRGFVAEGCEKDIETYCNNVTEGDGRMLACLYAHSDKISSQCEYQLYDSAILLQRLVSKLVYVSTECDEDTRKYCSSVAVGEGRLLNCLDKNADKISQGCARALRDIRNK